MMDLLRSSTESSTPSSSSPLSWYDPILSTGRWASIVYTAKTVQVVLNRLGQSYSNRSRGTGVGGAPKAHSQQPTSLGLSFMRPSNETGFSKVLPAWWHGFKAARATNGGKSSFLLRDVGPHLKTVLPREIVCYTSYYLGKEQWLHNGSGCHEPTLAFHVMEVVSYFVLGLVSGVLSCGFTQPVTAALEKSLQFRGQGGGGYQVGGVSLKADVFGATVSKTITSSSAFHKNLIVAALSRSVFFGVYDGVAKPALSPARSRLEAVIQWKVIDSEKPSLPFLCLCGYIAAFCSFPVLTITSEVIGREGGWRKTLQNEFKVGYAKTGTGRQSLLHRAVWSAVSFRGFFAGSLIALVDRSLEKRRFGSAGAHSGSLSRPFDDGGISSRQVSTGKATWTVRTD